MSYRGFKAPESGRGMPVNHAAEAEIRRYQALEAARLKNPSALASTMLLQANAGDAARKAAQVDEQR